MYNKEDKPLESEDDSYYGVGSFIWEIIKVFFWALIIIIPIRIFLFQPFFVQGASMEPNFENGDYLIVNEFGYKKTSFSAFGKDVVLMDSFKELSRQDVVVFRYPQNPKQFYIKRVIGLPGERIKIEGGRITIFNEDNPDGFLLDESSYLPKGLMTGANNTIDVVLGKDKYYVLGDNRRFSHDSRTWGPLSKKDIVGKVLLRAWPVAKAEIL